ncbi:MAG: hypothetical protein ABW021_09165 [Acidimicrobiia bacterium]|jgi:hypothetical protein
MSCVPITPDMSYLLDALRGYPVSTDVQEQLRAMLEWEQARKWGWIMRTGELTDMGSRHASPISKGIVHD